MAMVEVPREARIDTPGSDMARPHVKPLTGLRFIAALLVVMFHFLHFGVPGGSGPGITLKTRGQVYWGH